MCAIDEWPLSLTGNATFEGSDMKFQTLAVAAAVLLLAACVNTADRQPSGLSGQITVESRNVSDANLRVYILPSSTEVQKRLSSPNASEQASFIAANGRETPVADDGNFAFGNLAEGEYLLAVVHRKQALASPTVVVSRQIARPDGQRLRIVLP